MYTIIKLRLDIDIPEGFTKLEKFSLNTRKAKPITVDINRVVGKELNLGESVYSEEVKIEDKELEGGLWIKSNIVLQGLVG